jgi:hypothetical protein
MVLKYVTFKFTAYKFSYFTYKEIISQQKSKKIKKVFDTNKIYKHKFTQTLTHLYGSFH